MENTIINNPVRAMMKPMPESLIQNNRAAILAAQEQEVCHMLDTAQYSLTVADMIHAYPDFKNFPGYDEQRAFYCRGMYERRLISNTCKRLEQKGAIISTLLCGCRVYSLPMENGGEN